MMCLPSIEINMDCINNPKIIQTEKFKKKW